MSTTITPKSAIQNGAEWEDGRYTFFGGYRAGSGPNSITSHAYTSQRENMEIGLYYYNARYYAPTLARFISADTLIPDPANPQAFNRYSYVENRPLNFNDPTGHCLVGYSGEVRWGEGPYGTSGICPNTMHWITEDNAIRAQTNQNPLPPYPEPDGVSLFVSADPVQSPRISGTGGFEVLFNSKTGDITVFAVLGAGGDVGAGIMVRAQINEVYNIGDNNLKYSGLFVSFNAAAAAEVGLSGGGAYTPNQEGNFINYWLPDLESAYSIGIGGAGGIGIAGMGSVVEYIPLFTLGPGDEFTPHAGWYLFENEQQWFISQGIGEAIGILGEYVGFDPEDYDWGRQND